MKKKVRTKVKIAHPPIAEWKKIDTEVIRITVKINDHDYSIGFYWTPSVFIIDLCLSFEAVGDLDKAMHALANNTCIGGDRRQQMGGNIAKYARVELWKAAGFA